MRNSAERMGHLILDLLAYTDLSRSDFQKQSVNLDAVCRSILRMFSDEIEKIGAQVSAELPAAHVIGDTAGIERVLVNLLANALKFAHPDRVPSIRIHSERRRSNVRISVTDNGIGVDPKYANRIFGVFERLGSNSAGTGIGLAIVKRSVEKMGGTVGVDSRPGVGSRFWFELPEALAAKSEPALEQSISIKYVAMR
jgi:signal transduction histidine kinase